MYQVAIIATNTLKFIIVLVLSIVILELSLKSEECVLYTALEKTTTKTAKILLKNFIYHISCPFNHIISNVTICFYSFLHIMPHQLCYSLKIQPIGEQIGCVGMP